MSVPIEITSPLLKSFFSEKNFFADMSAPEAKIAEIAEILWEEPRSEKIPMINTHLRAGNVSEAEECCVIDIGGSNVRAYHLQRITADATATRGISGGISIGGTKADTSTDNTGDQTETAMPMHQGERQGDHQGDKWTAQRLWRKAMPGTDGETVTREAFLEAILLPIVPLARKLEADLGRPVSLKVSFSYPARVDEHFEGYPIGFSKEIRADALIGMPLCETFREYLKAAGSLQWMPEITVLNDTVAVYLAGLRAMQNPVDDVPTAMIGVVYGTGFNICYADRVSRQDKTLALFNTEIGACPGLTPTELDNRLDARSEHPGTGLAEKRISGSYLPHVYHEVLIGLGEWISRDPVNRTDKHEDLRKGLSLLGSEFKNFLQTLEKSHDWHDIPSNVSLGAFLRGEAFPYLGAPELSLDERMFLSDTLSLVAKRSACYAAMLTAGVAERILLQNADDSSSLEKMRLTVALEGGFVSGFPEIQAVYKDFLQKWSARRDRCKDLQVIILEDAVPLGAGLAEWRD